MPFNISLQEPRSAKPAPIKPFGLGDDGNAVHECLRLLLGSTDAFDLENQRIIALSDNYLRKGGTRTRNPNKISSIVLEIDVKESEYASIIAKILSRNYKFFSGLREELTLCLIARKQKRYTESFLYIYRVLEYISVAFPVLHALSKQDFFHSHKFIKSLIQTEKDGELKVLNAAIPEFAASANLNNLIFDFSVSGLDKILVDRIRFQFEKYIKQNVRGFEFEQQDDILFKVPFNGIVSLIVASRNRMFHYRIGDHNFDLSAIGGSEVICDLLLKEVIHWFSLVYFELVKTLISQQI